MSVFNLKIFQVVGSEIAVSSEDGNLVFNQIKEAIEHNQSVVIDFKDIRIMTTAFLNSAIGQLYSKFKSDELSKALSVENLSDSDRLLLSTVTSRAKEYFADKDSIDPLIKDSLGDE